MSLAHNQSIVRAGLVLHVDPRNVKSYSGSGTTLTDISGNNIPITFVNPNANTVSISGGYLIFNPRNMKDDTNASYYIISDSRVAGLITAITVECWVYVSGLFSFQPRPVSPRISESSSPLGFSIANGSITYEINTTTVGWTGQTSSVFTSDCKQNSWCCIQQTTNDATKEFITYVNGIQVAKITYTGIPNTGGGYLLGRGFYAGINNFIGCIAAVKIYNRVLTADELLKNYEAQRYRYTTAMITDGLILNLDATNSSSYSGTGTTWYDKSGKVGDGTILNSPTFTSGYSGYFTFNGSSHYVNVPTPNLPYGAAAGTICGWATTSTIASASGFHWIFSYGTPINTQSRFIGINGNAFYFGGYGSDVSAIGVPLNTWFHIVGVYDGTTAYLYVNGVLLASAAKTWNTLLSTAQLGRQTNTGEYWNGNISQLQCYNRALSATEVLQNYNVSRGLYTTGIVNDALVLSLDAGITTSYPGSGTTWTDLSGYSNNATMYGSVPFATDVAPCFDFASVTGAISANATLGFTFASNMVATTGSFTFSCWVKNPNSSLSQLGLFGNSGSGNGFRFGIATTGVYVLCGGSTSFFEGYMNFLSAASSTTWNYVTCIYDRANATPQFILYLNGAYQTNNTGMTSDLSAATTAVPGLVHSSCCGLYTGKLAAFTVHNKALSSTEITQNFNAQRGRYGV